jgi:hypothetical protein
VLSFGFMDGGSGSEGEGEQSEPTSKRLKPILDRNKWIGLPFVIGSVLFIAAVPIADSSLVASALLFFVGSSLYLIGASADAWNARATALNGARWRASVESADTSSGGWTGYLRHRFWASCIQAFGAVLFQIMVIAGLIQGLDPLLVDVFIWEPDVVGSLCFVISSAMLVSASHPLAGRGDFRDRIKGASLFNLGGSLCFLASSLGAFVPLSSGEEISPLLVGSGTMVGGLLFLIGSWPGLPERLRSTVAG